MSRSQSPPYWTASRKIPESATSGHAKRSLTAQLYIVQVGRSFDNLPVLKDVSVLLNIPSAPLESSFSVSRLKPSFIRLKHAPWCFMTALCFYERSVLRAAGLVKISGEGLIRTYYSYATIFKMALSCQLKRFLIHYRQRGQKGFLFFSFSEAMSSLGIRRSWDTTVAHLEAGAKGFASRSNLALEIRWEERDTRGV